MKGKYITTQIRLACLSKPPVKQKEAVQKTKFYWDQIIDLEKFENDKEEENAAEMQFNSAA
jgi:hypothetical protein